MTPSATVKVRLLALSAVTSLVAQRVYVDLFKQKPTKPSIRVQRISELEDAHLRGAKAMRRARVQVDAVADSLEDATAVSDAVNGDGAGSGLSGWTGTVSGQKVFACLPAGVRSDYEADELKLWRVSRDYIVWLR